MVGGRVRKSATATAAGRVARAGLRAKPRELVDEVVEGARPNPLPEPAEAPDLQGVPATSRECDRGDR